MIAVGDRPVGELVAENPLSADVFDKYQIDYCCQGHHTLEAACQETGLPLEKVLSELEEPPRTEDATDWRSVPLGELADHIMKRHHTYLRSALPSIKQKLGKVIGPHQEAHGEELARLTRILGELENELTQHMMKEEMVLFPLIRQMEKAHETGTEAPFAPGGSVNNPIRMMVHEHDDAGEALRAIRNLTSNYTPPEDACDTYRALYSQLQELERDLHMHIHLENNILFPRASELETKLAAV